MFPCRPYPKRESYLVCSPNHRHSGALPKGGAVRHWVLHVYGVQHCAHRRISAEHTVVSSSAGGRRWLALTSSATSSFEVQLQPGTGRFPSLVGPRHFSWPALRGWWAHRYNSSTK